MISRSRISLLALFAALAVAGPTRAADYPTRPVKWVVPYPPAGTTDVLARIVAQWLTEKMGQPFVVENKPGAGNNIGVEAVVNSPPDGYTMLLVNPANGINATLYKNLNYNFTTDLVPVAIVMRSPVIMQVHPSVPAKTVPEFVEWLRQQDGKASYASSGTGQAPDTCPIAAPHRRWPIWWPGSPTASSTISRPRSSSCARIGCARWR